MITSVPRKKNSLWSSERIFTLGLCILFLGISIQYLLKIMKPRSDGMTASAVLRWSSQITMMESGEDVHQSHQYPNAPIMAMILSPFAAIAKSSPISAALLWYYLKVLMAFLCFRWTFQMVEEPAKPISLKWKIIICILSLRPILGDLSHGNVNIFILFLITLSLFSFVRGFDYLSGVVLGLAIACKVTPLLLFFYFIWKGAGKVILGGIAGLVLSFILLPSLWLGWDTNLHDLISWFKVMILPYLGGSIVTPEHNNQSIPGLLSRMFSSAPSFSSFIGDRYVPLRFQNLVDIGSIGVQWLNRCAMVIFALVIFFRCRQPISVGNQTQTKSSIRQSWQLQTEFALILIGMLMFSERTWKHHCVTLLLPFAVLGYACQSGELSQWPRRCLTFALGSITLLIMSTSTGITNDSTSRVHALVEKSVVLGGPATIFGSFQAGLLTDSIGKQMQVYGAYVWAFIIFSVSLSWLLGIERRANTSFVLTPESSSGKEMISDQSAELTQIELKKTEEIPVDRTHAA